MPACCSRAAPEHPHTQPQLAPRLPPPSALLSSRGGPSLGPWSKIWWLANCRDRLPKCGCWLQWRVSVVSSVLCVKSIPVSSSVCLSLLRCGCDGQSLVMSSVCVKNIPVSPSACLFLLSERRCCCPVQQPFPPAPIVYPLPHATQTLSLANLRRACAPCNPRALRCVWPPRHCPAPMSSRRANWRSWRR